MADNVTIGFNELEEEEIREKGNFKFNTPDNDRTLVNTKSMRVMVKSIMLKTHIVVGGMGSTYDALGEWGSWMW